MDLPIVRKMLDSKLTLSQAIRLNPYYLAHSLKKPEFKLGTILMSMQSQPVISIADIQWVLHHLPKIANLSIKINQKILTKNTDQDNRARQLED